ncbi:MAG: NADP-specific glutamate dehydrogenase [Rikenellaceae bacterium]|nr:NADP-specific glutamate dehydrogenase [Rikenellaceae bacterium]MBQ5595981.1 NADP-specific glutamate dehydrogenase [Rikenellaceae bacterium]MBQ5854008.1 NADP-specific glutamate dehydrogenase [Rikenellaceae bacterium]MBQ5894293.1 NADP-specific glutamate dehydrogenase [Rikenellaceae bacterium]
MNVNKLMADLELRHPGEKEYLQAVREVLMTVEEVYNQHPEFEANRIAERIVEPDRQFTFKVTWVDDKGDVQVNTGYRIQFNNAIGPYKGGLRFHPSVNPSILKFLGFEQIFKNALTTLPMGGAKGGSDFNPKGKSAGEVMRFCQAFMTELWRHIGPETDVPAGDIGVGGREIGYLYGMYRKLARENTGVLTGKGMTYGGSLIRPEATGFGAVYFLRQMLETAGDNIKGKVIGISGFGNVAWGVATKATELGAKVVTISGPDGYIYDPAGLNEEKIAYMLELRASNNDVVAPYAEKFAGSTFYAGRKPWEQKFDIAMPCATQNELNGDDAKALVANGVQMVAEVSNMGCTPEAIETFLEAKIPYGPGKAVNAGGVATSGLEMTQNAQKLNWTAAEVDAKLLQIMSSIHTACLEYGREGEYINYMKGANIAGFMKVAKSMVEQGIL